MYLQCRYTQADLCRAPLRASPPTRAAPAMVFRHTGWSWLGYVFDLILVLGGNIFHATEYKEETDQRT